MRALRRRARSGFPPDSLDGFIIASGNLRVKARLPSLSWGDFCPMYAGRIFQSLKKREKYAKVKKNEREAAVWKKKR
jgi:hypothetical protein